MKTFNNLDECIQDIKRLRIQVDSLTQTGQGEWMTLTHETRNALDHLLIAKAWLGKLLGDVSKSETPYIQVRDTKKIPETQDVATVIKFDGHEYSQLSMCNSQRNIIETTITEFEDMYLAPNLSQIVQFYNDGFGNGINLEEIKEIEKKRIYFNYRYYDLIRDHLQQARFWYGFEISNLRTV